MPRNSLDCGLDGVLNISISQNNINITFYLLDKYIKFVFKWIPEMIDDLFERAEANP